MQGIMSFVYGILFFLFVQTSLSAQANIWQNATVDQLNTEEERLIVPNKFRAYLVDTTALKNQLYPAVHERTTSPAQSSNLITLPTPDGEWETFRIVAYDMMQPQLQQTWWYIKTWRGVSTRNPGVTIRLDWTSRGFHAMVLERGNTWFIDPYFWNQRDYYQVYYKKHYPAPTEVFECLTVSEREEENTGSGIMRAGDCQLREYRLALACTGEYADFHGGTTNEAASAMATSLNRVNGVYEMDLAIRLVLVANNNSLIYLDGATDPYSNGNGSAMLGQNQTTCDDVIGTANYDIGHVYSTGGGGVAYLRSPCRSDRKAGGVTGQSTPVGDPFDIDYVAHEMGHQFGGNHTQNNNCNRSSASMEPGSASTIMGYAGICAPNVQSNSDAYYHGRNIQEIADYMETGNGNTCANIIDMSNTAPTIIAQQDYDIPGGTPFVLTGNATDPNGDDLFYCWEQYDNEAGEEMPPEPTNTQGPMFRSFFPTAAPERYFPRLSDLVDNIDPTWETLPETDRDMDFRVTVRDFDGTYGCTTEDNITLSVDASAGPFLVTNPNTNITWTENTQATIEWDVAGTSSAPISCSNVDLLLSYDGGLSYPVTLLSNTTNDGSQLINVPSGTTTTARVMVRCADNVFFDISNTDFIIDNAAAPNYTITYDDGSLTACAGSNNALDFVVNTSSINGYDDPLSLSATNIPLGVIVNFSANPINPGDNVTVTLSNFTNLLSGNYSITVVSSSSVGDKTVDLPFTLEPPPTAPGLIEPESGVSGIDIFPYFDWNTVPTASNYTLEIATDFEFDDIVFTVNTNQSQYTLTNNLAPLLVHYWRVRSNNDECGAGSYSTRRRFETESCYYYESNDFMPISSGAPANYDNVLTIPHSGDLDDLDVLNLDMSHTRVGDLEVSLEAPNGTTRNLFRYICGGNDDVFLSFNDDASSSLGCPLNDGSKVQPNETLSPFNSLQMNGNWTLKIRDNVSQNGGSLNGWSLKVCTKNFSLLPVTWLSFTADAKQELIALNWETTAEEDNAGFDLERRSAYETTFQPIAWIPATDQPTDRNIYTYDDKEVQPGLTYYYRLRQVDYSGSESYSEIRSAQLSSNTPQWAYYPNPATDKLQLRFWNTTASIQLRLIDTRGRTLRQWQAIPEELQTVQLNALPTGVYWLKASSQDWQATERIVIH